MNTDPSGLCTFLLGACGLAFGFLGPSGPDDVVACGPFVICMLAAGYTLTQIAEEIADATGAALAEAERIVEEAFGRHEAPEDEPDPIRDPDPFIPGDPLPDPDPNRPCPEDEDEDCLEGRLPSEQALIYSIFARHLWKEVSFYDPQNNAPVVVAATRVKDPSTNQCVDVIGVNSHASGNVRRIQRWNSARQMLQHLIIPPNKLIGASNSTPQTYIAGVQGHAETNLYNHVVTSLGQPVEFMGISQKPCSAFQAEQDAPTLPGCDTWLRGLSNRPEVVYFDKQRFDDDVRLVPNSLDEFGYYVPFV